MMKEQLFRGMLAYTPQLGTLKIVPEGWLYTEDGVHIKAVYENELPEQLKHVPIRDFGSALLLPGMSDLHVHAPQYSFRGSAMDLELIDWLNTYTFPEEEKYADLAYAQKAYRIFTEDLKNSFTTRACIFGTVHPSATLLLMDQLEATGLCTMVGKVNQDRHSPEGLQEASASASLKATREWLRDSRKYRHTQPVLTPRFLPSCSDALMEGLAELKAAEKLCLQSHLSENPDEIQWVQELCPDSSSYADAYDRRRVMSGQTIMAHCVYSDDAEIDILKRTGTYVAHCPQSNMNLASGIAPVRRFLQAGLNVGLGTDIAGGAQLSMLRCITDAVQVSKMYWRLMDATCQPLSFKEAFYLATKGGGSFFGKTGSFEAGYDLDLLVIDDTALRHPGRLTDEQRLERIFYLADTRNLVAKYVKGRKII